MTSYLNMQKWAVMVYVMECSHDNDKYVYTLIINVKRSVVLLIVGLILTCLYFFAIKN